MESKLDFVCQGVSNVPQNINNQYQAEEKECIAPALSSSDSRKPKSMQRAKEWTRDVENAFRFQLAGYRDSIEYSNFYPSPEYWNQEGLIKCLQAKKTGYFMYFRRTRECEDKHLNRIILYEY